MESYGRTKIEGAEVFSRASGMVEEFDKVTAGAVESIEEQNRSLLGTIATARQMPGATKEAIAAWKALDDAVRTGLKGKAQLNAESKLASRELARDAQTTTQVVREAIGQRIDAARREFELVRILRTKAQGAAEQRINAIRREYDAIRVLQPQMDAFFKSLSRAGATPLIRDLAKLGKTASGPVQEALKELLITIGKLSTDQATGQLKMNLQDVDKAVLKLLQKTPELSGVWAKFGSGLTETAKKFKSTQTGGNALIDMFKRLNLAMGGGLARMARYGIGIGLIVVGFRTLRNAIRTTRQRLQGLFTQALRSAQQFVSQGINLVASSMASMVKDSVRINTLLAETGAILLGAAKNADWAAAAWRRVDTGRLLRNLCHR